MPLSIDLLSWTFLTKPSEKWTETQPKIWTEGRKPTRHRNTDQQKRSAVYDVPRRVHYFTEGPQNRHYVVMVKDPWGSGQQRKRIHWRPLIFKLTLTTTLWLSNNSYGTSSKVQSNIQTSHSSSCMQQHLTTNKHPVSRVITTCGVHNPNHARRIL